MGGGRAYCSPHSGGHLVFFCFKQKVSVILFKNFSRYFGRLFFLWFGSKMTEKI